MALFAGTENFTPVFTGKQLSIAAGQGAGQSIARGTAASQRGQAQQLDEDKFSFQKQHYSQELDLKEREQAYRDEALKFRRDQVIMLEELGGMFGFLKQGMP